MYTISKYIMNPSSKTVFMSNPESLLYTFNKCYIPKILDLSGRIISYPSSSG